MCGLHTAGPVIRSVLQVKCIRRQSAKYEINKRKLSDVAGYVALAASPSPRGASAIQSSPGCGTMGAGSKGFGRSWQEQVCAETH